MTVGQYFPVESVVKKGGSYSIYWKRVLPLKIHHSPMSKILHKPVVTLLPKRSLAITRNSVWWPTLALRQPFPSAVHNGGNVELVVKIPNFSMPPYNKKTEIIASFYAKLESIFLQVWSKFYVRWLQVNEIEKWF